jgi:trehalose synthase-fused probable maltokinase
LNATVSRAEQSNSSIVFENRYILKLFRKLEPGINPDIEIGSFLTEHHFRNTPAVLGTLEYRRHDGVFAYAAILQAFVRNQGDAWKFTLDALKGFFEHAVREARPAPHFKSNHPLHLAETTMPATVREYIGDYLDSARLLGERTAEMHAVLASDDRNPDFRPIPFTSEDAASLHRELLKESEQTFELLRRKEKDLDQTTTRHAHKVLAQEAQVRRCLASLPHAPVKALRIRHHGDYHLGQVLVTEGDFMIIDFEGEPARPIEVRREKALAVRDVAGMVRSFQYAAYAALRASNGVTQANHTTVESWADYWAAWVSATYLCGYFDKAGRAPFAPADGKERRTLLDAFLLQKVLYEVMYELNNRPDWVDIPLRGILNLLD